MKRRKCYLEEQNVIPRHKSMSYLQKTNHKKFSNVKNYRKVKDHCHFTGKYRGATYSISNSKFNVPGELFIVFHIGSKYGYNFITKILANEFEGQFECFEENTEKQKTFPVPIEKKVIKTNKAGNESVATLSYKKFFLIVQDLQKVHY